MQVTANTSHQGFPSDQCGSCISLRFGCRMKNKAAVPIDNHGNYKVLDQIWSVGSKYILHEHIGCGSYGDVCRATDRETNQLIALKKVKDVLSSPLLAKRILREVCIMRRLSSAYIISLTDVFVVPSSESPNAVDLYIATEFAEKGDLYHLKEPITADDAKLLIWQLLMGVRYLHACRVWHRDIKSENVLLTAENRVKICDFGLARSAEEAASGYEPIVTSVASCRKVLTRQYTKMVVTPSYRAPEVIMSRGEYKSTIDIWSLGCIFWELLVRAIFHSTGPPTTLFNVRTESSTPNMWENYAKDGSSPLAEQLDVIFNVIGTPSWKDIQSIPSENWRAYLKGLPGRAGNLLKSLIGLVDENAIDLLFRMLEFNPARRCTAEEALAHTYFTNLAKPADFKQLVEEPTQTSASKAIWKIKDPSMALEQLERELEASEREPDGGRRKLIALLMAEIRQHEQERFLKSTYLCSLKSARLQILDKSNQHPALQGQTNFCTCVLSVSNNASVIIHTSNTNQSHTSDQIDVNQASLKLEVGVMCDEVPEATSRVEANGVSNASNDLTIPSSIPSKCRRKAHNILHGNGKNMENATCLVDGYLPRRSPRIKENGTFRGEKCLPRKSPRSLVEQAAELPERKRAHMQAG